MITRRVRELCGTVGATLCGLGLVGVYASVAARAEGLPPSPPLTYPAVCEVPYTLAPGERAVLLCAAPVPRAGLEGLAQISSGHEAVDTTLLIRFGRGRFAFSVTNQSDDTVTATARGEQW